ncbi:MAG TPA: hypothetical protein VE031_11090 [Chthoniobacterales bacterium]|nr:hypothetical protein [Chthoniobacterales bacterium]
MNFVNELVGAAIGGILAAFAVGVLIEMLEHKKPLNRGFSADQKYILSQYTIRVFYCVWLVAFILCLILRND